MPRTDDELMLSLAFTDHYFGLETLQKIGRDIETGRALQLAVALKMKLAPAVQEAKLMLGINRVAQAKTPDIHWGRQATKLVRPVAIYLILLVASAIIVGTLLDFIPWNVRRYLAYLLIPAGLMWFLWSWSKWDTKRRGNQNELDVLEEAIEEHESGRRDNATYIEKQLYFIEREHNHTPKVIRLIERARRAIKK